MCHIPKIFGEPQPSGHPATIAPDMLHANADKAMGCQVFCLRKMCINMATRAVGNDNNRVVFSRKGIMNTKGNRPFFAKCAALSGQQNVSRRIAASFR